MNEALYPDSASGAPTISADHRMEVPNTSLLPGSEKAPPAAVGVLKNVVKGAHEVIDRLADGAMPAVTQLGDSASSAEHRLQAKAEQLLRKRNEWLERSRTAVRRKPLAAIAAALTLGIVIGRIAR